MTVELICKSEGMPIPVREHRFATPRRWRFDYAWVDQRIALEQEGGLWVYGRHNRAASMIKDMEKYNSASALGWRVFRFTPQQVESGEWVDIIKPLFEGI